MEKIKVLFVCTHNSARSQMAEGLLRHLADDRFEVMSAGTEATHLRPLAVRAMDELGIDISGQESKTPERYLGQPFDYVITVCDVANEACPFFPHASERLHWSLPDPAAAQGTEEVRLEVFRSVRDRLRDHIEGELVRTGEETDPMRKQKVLFLCTQNSARSQMAEAFLSIHRAAEKASLLGNLFAIAQPAMGGGARPTAHLSLHLFLKLLSDPRW